MQESLLAVHNQRHTYEPAQPVTAWLHAIARYKLVDLLRRRGRRDLLHDSMDDVPELPAAEDREAAAVAMHALYGIRPTLAQDAALSMFWWKLAFVAAVAAAGVAAVRRLARPGAALARLPWLLIAPVAVLWLLAAAEFTGAAPADRSALVLGQTWQVCAFRIAGLSLPAFVALLWAMRGLAPTKLRLAGAAAGLCAGGVGALAYSVHCPELAASFIGVWYVIGMLIPAVAGALIGPRVLRW